METDAPQFANDSGAPVIDIGAKEFKCIGESPPFDHPHIYLAMGDETEIICPYCGTLFRYDPSVGHAEAHPIHHRSIEPEEDTSRLQPRRQLIMPREPTRAQVIATQIRVRVTRLARTSGRFVFWFLLILAIELPIAKAFEWIAEESGHWLHSIDIFQKEFADAVDLVQPWRVYDLFSARSGELAAEFASGNATPESATPLLIPWFAFRYTVRVLVGDPNRLVGTLTAIGLIASLMISVYIGLTKKPKGLNWDIYVFLWLIFGIAGIIVAFSLIVVVLKATMGFGNLVLGQVVHFAKLYAASSAVIALFFALKVRSEHATVHWLKHHLDRLWPVRRNRKPDRWEDPQV